MNDLEFKKLMEQGWRRGPTVEEQKSLSAYLAGHDGAQAQWEEELAISRLLSNLPDAHVSSNFTARVLQAVQRKTAPVDRGLFQRPRLNWLPRFAVIGALVGAAVLSIEQYRSAQRAHLARDVATISQAVVPQEWLQDFEAINRLSHPSVDEELLAALR